MKSFIAFLKKEFLAQLRTGKLWILLGAFVLVGIMNPATAKLTPWLMEKMAESLAQSGMSIQKTEVTALDSWVQFFKNLLIAEIVFVLLESSIFAREYRTGTLVLSLTKGLERWKVVVSKAIVLMLLWTAGYFLCFGVTYGISAVLWDNSIVKNLAFAVFCWWVFGLWIVMLMVLFSVLARSNTGVLLGTGGVILVCYLLSMVPKVKDWLPFVLTDGNSLIYGLSETGKYTGPLIITAVISLVCLIVSIPVFDRKQL